MNVGELPSHPCNTGLGVYEKKSTLFKRYLDEQQ